MMRIKFPLKNQIESVRDAATMACYGVILRKVSKGDSVSEQLWVVKVNDGGGEQDISRRHIIGYLL